MPLDRDSFERHLEVRGAALWHVTSADAVEAILHDGLRPGSELAFSSKAGFFATRPGRVYLCSNLLALGIVEVAGARAYLQVDGRMLDPECIDPDEDLVQDSFYKPGVPWVSERPPKPADLSAANPEVAGTALAEWAESTPGFDAPEVTAKSLDGGRIGYRGTIPPEALTLVRLPSEAAQYFRQGVAAALDDPGLDLAPAPQLGLYKTEIARATILARSLIHSSVRATGHAVDEAELNWRFPEDAQYTRDALSRWASDARRRDDYARAGLVSAGERLAELAHDFQPEVGWSFNRDLCVEVALAAVDTVQEMHVAVGLDHAAIAARDAMDALVAVPDQH